MANAPNWASMTSLRAKDASDWVKIFVLLAGMIGSGYAAYTRLTDKVEQHTQSLEEIRNEVHGLRMEEEVHHQDAQQKIGRVEMYLSSQDKEYWRVATSAANSAAAAEDSARRARRSSDAAADAAGTPREKPQR